MIDWSRERIAWAAGLIEGEGCIARQVTYRSSRQYNYWQLKVASTDRDVLEKLQGILGVGRIYSQPRYEAHHKPAWQLKVYRQIELYAVLAAIFPFMCHRRREKVTEALTEMSARSIWRTSKGTDAV